MTPKIDCYRVGGSTQPIFLDLGRIAYMCCRYAAFRHVLACHMLEVEASIFPKPQ